MQKPNYQKMLESIIAAIPEGEASQLLRSLLELLPGVPGAVLPDNAALLQPEHLPGGGVPQAR